MSQTWIRGPVCGVDNCTSRLYRSIDGRKICQYGHVMEGNIEINDDQDDNFVQTKRLNIQLTGLGGDFSSQKSQTKNPSLINNSRYYGDQAKEQYLLCLQVILQKQVKVFCDLFIDNDSTKGLIPEFTSMVKLYWVRLLQAYSISSHARGIVDSSTLSDQAENSNINKLPTNIDLICLIYFAAVKFKLYIYVADFLEALRLNSLPYMKCAYLVPKQLTDRLPLHYIKLLEPVKLPQQNEMYQKIYNMMPILGIESITLTPNYFYPLVFRVFSKVFMIPNAPQLFLIWCKTMAKLDISLSIEAINKNHPVDNSHQNNNHNKKNQFICFPEIQVISLCLLVLKLYLVYCFKLDHIIKTKDNNSEISIYPFDSLVWLENLIKYEIDHEFPIPQTSIDEEDILNWSDTKINRYCQWVYQNLIPKKNQNLSATDSATQIYEKEELSMMDKRLFQIFNFDSNEYNNEGSKVFDGNDMNDAENTLEKLFSVNKKATKAPNSKEVCMIENYLVERLSYEYGITKKIIDGSCILLERKILGL